MGSTCWIDQKQSDHIFWSLALKEIATTRFNPIPRTPLLFSEIGKEKKTEESKEKETERREDDALWKGNLYCRNL